MSAKPVFRVHRKSKRVRDTWQLWSNNTRCRFCRNQTKESIMLDSGKVKCCRKCKKNYNEIKNKLEDKL